MMSEFRRRLLMQNALKGSSGDLPFDYVKDGLVFHLDGINKGSDSNAWTDLIGGVKFNYTNCILNSNSVEFDGVKSYAISDNYNFKSDESTSFEICYYTDNFSFSILLMAGKKGQYAFGYNGSEFAFTTGERATYRQKDVYNNTISFTRGGCILNKGNATHQGVGSWAIKKEGINALGGRPLSINQFERMFKGKIYSIRIYNRKLTKEEMLHNQQIDIDRFFGGVVPQ